MMVTPAVQFQALSEAAPAQLSLVRRKTDCNRLGYYRPADDED